MAIAVVRVLTGGDDSEQVVESSGSGFGACRVSCGSDNRHLTTERSVPTEEERNLPIVPVRGCLSTSAGNHHSEDSAVAPLCNTYKVSVYGRKLAIQNFAEAIRTDQNLREHLPRPSGKRLVCHCLPTQECHADRIIS